MFELDHSNFDHYFGGALTTAKFFDRNRLLDSDTIEDIAQDAVIAAWKTYNSQRGASFKTHLNTKVKYGVIAEINRIRISPSNIDPEKLDHRIHAEETHEDDIDVNDPPTKQPYPPRSVMRSRWTDVLGRRNLLFKSSVVDDTVGMQHHLFEQDVCKRRQFFLDKFD